MLKESHRIRTLFINPTKISWKAEQCFTESVFTHLQHLRIDPQSYNTSSNLATAILQQPPPSLQTLTLVEVPINWNTLVGLPQTITSLYVKPSYPSDSDCADILAALEGLPHLELLHIHGLPRVAAKSRNVVTLKNLRECSLGADLVSANYLTQYLSLPSLTRFEESVSTTDSDNVYSGSEICELLLAMLHCYRRMTGMSGQFASAHVKPLPFSCYGSATVSFDTNPCVQTNQHDVSFTLHGSGWDSRS
ncbi:hypothetical protein QCA50_005967 [Cerrena zonata]|uniref:Uncharacterized protein n=1 Tax=Cerrena zonata TaxID=2478898 RepID=A0AAW0GNT4_9APHY